MIVKRIKMENFRGYDYKEIDGLGNLVLIEGDNETGKTTIGDAICFALTGCLTTGSNKADKIIKEGKRKAAVEVVFSMGGREYTLKRVRTATKSEVYLNDNPLPTTQETINSLFYQGRLELKKWFLSIFSANYFFSLEPREMREVITSVLLPPKQEEVLARMDEISRQVLSGIQVGDIDYMLKNYREEYKTLEGELIKIEGSLAMLGQEISKEIPGKVEDPSDQLLELKKSFKSQLERKEILHKLVNERQKLLTEYQKQKNMLEQLPEKPDVSQGKCPTCGQPVTAHNARMIIEQWEQRCALIKSKNKRIMEVMSQIKLKGVNVTQQIKALQESTNLEEISNIEAEIQRLEENVKLALQHNAKVDALTKAVETAKKKYEEMKKDYEVYKKELLKIKTIIQALDIYRKTEAEILSEQISSRLKNVSIQLYEIVRSTGEIKQTFKLQYKGKDLENCSNSGKRKAHLEIAGALNDITGAAIPIFFDDAESVTKWEWPIGTEQIFISKVRENVQLTVTVNNEEMQKEVV